MLRRGLVLALIALAGCGGDELGPVEPGPEPPALRGQVLDADGAPVGGAGINLIYELEGWPKVAAAASDTLLQNRPNPFANATGLPVLLTAERSVRVRVLGSAGDTLRTLFDGTLTAGEHLLAWDGRDDAGARLPNGVYRARIEFAHGAAAEIGGMLSLRLDPAILAESALVVTDDGGRFALPFDALPIGAMIPVLGEDGVLMGIFPVASAVQVHAAVGETAWARAGVELGDGLSDVTIALQLPPVRGGRARGLPNY